MSLHVLPPPPPQPRLRTPADLVDALGLPFSDQQLAAITAPLEPGVIIAGAGSGKTTVMAARVVWLVGTGRVRPEEVLGLTFTRKAAAELSQRVRKALVDAGVVDDKTVDESGEQVVMTYDAFAARLVSEHGLRLGFEADPTMVSGATRFRLAARVVAAAAGPFEFLSRLRPATVTERVLKLDADLTSHLVDVRALDAHARELVVGWDSAPLNNRGNAYVDVKKARIAVQERLELASLVRDYQALKTRLGVVEFADQMAIAARLATEVPQVGADLRAAFRVVLLDEYQDTSAAQAAMLRGLFSGPADPRAVGHEGMGHAVTAVGDPFQAIYGWRGAAASNITTFADTFRRADGGPAARFALTVNRRSGPSILDVANVLSRPLRAAGLASPGPDEEQEGQGPSTGSGGPLLQAPPGTDPGRVCAATFTSWPEEVTWVADRIVEARRQGTVAHWADIAVLMRRNADIGPLYAELTAREVPVEIVGLGGLLGLPEVMDVTATLRLVDDVTANPDLVRLLTGPRWRVGPRDLALLGRRARELARVARGGADVDGTEERRVGSQVPDPAQVRLALVDAVADLDPTEVVSLLDALEDPGDAPYSTAARRRFARVASELASLRAHADEPVLDLARRVVTTLGLDVELVATPELERTNRRDQLGAFLDAVADYVDVDGDASLSGLLAWLQAELDSGTGLEQAVPSDREAVKLLTVHKAKGLEWELVFLPGLVEGVFPSDRVTDNWVTTPGALPADLRGDAGSIPQLADTSNAAIVDYKAALKAQQLLAEDRLAYVAVTRARSTLVGSGHWWRPDLVRPRVASTYLRAILAEAETQGQVLARADPPGQENPLVGAAAPVTWPEPLDPDALARREEAAAQVEAARSRFAATGSYGDPAAPPLLLDLEGRVSAWDADLDRLLREARESRSGDRTVELPASLPATALLRLNADPDAFAAALARPMPVAPSRAARSGTRFHAFVEQWFGERLARGGVGQGALVDPDDLSDRADADGPEEADLRAVCDAFTRTPFATRLPYAVEAPFSLALAGRLVRGRVDAVYAAEDLGGGGFPVAVAPGTRYLVVDWKTGGPDTADPLQLAVYRLAWAEASGVDVGQVEAVFVHVRDDRVVAPPLAGRAELERLLGGGETAPGGQ
ncbi:ATP-dependent DNA helicase [Microlunatus flavus]|uniref:DNA 3'-5' helicase n=1 Tax=Microlunatus flavus TaxID=1036181 RepID=A0A1H9I2X0_9ACTN|nr:ATP-dependent DNA helicase [Microlunatus flavus]SEQ68878.1 DNA helicase-2 / ATP-dependent DNA helicase PcrA [Microlunatus flavus]